MSASPEKQTAVRWKITLPRPLPAVWAIGILSVAYFILDLSWFSINPFIGSVYDLAHPKSAWVFNTELLPSTAKLIVLAITFIVLMYTLYILFFAFYYSATSEEAKAENKGQKLRTIAVCWWPQNPTPKDYTVSALFLATAIITFIEIVWIKSFNNHTLPVVALMFRSAVGVVSLGVILSVFINDYFKGIRKYLSYFYPSIASIAILGFALTKVDQTNSLIIDLLGSPLNFLLFSLFFLVAIFLVWFSPSYLLFTDEFFEDPKNNESFKKYHKPFTLGQIQYFRLINQHKDYLIELVRKLEKDKQQQTAFTTQKEEQEPPALKSSAPPPAQDNEASNPPPKKGRPLFASIRRILRLSPGQQASTIAAPLTQQDKELSGLFAYKGKEPAGFTIVRRLLGLSYIIVLVSLSSKVLADVFTMASWFRPLVLLVSIVLPLGVWYYYHVQLYQRKKIRMNIYSLIAFFIALQLACLVIVSCFNWIAALISLLVTVIISSVIFIIVAFYRTLRPHIDEIPDFDPPNKKELKAYLKQFNKWVTSTMLLLNFWVGRFALLFWLLLLLLPLSMPYLQFINPINIYLLLVNGLIAYITVVDRHLTIRNKMQKITAQIEAEKNNTRYKNNVITNTKYHYKIWAFVAIIFLIGAYFNKLGNSFHEIEYIPYPQTDAQQYDSYQSLEEYTQQFMHKLGVICDEEQQTSDCENPPAMLVAQKDTALLCCSPDSSDQPIILIASDGGGLKAAYWTMLILHRLDALGLYEDNVFLMSGASGGSIGMGMYTYLKAQGLDSAQIADKIEALVATNFLSTDFAGLLGKFPINYLPDFYGIHEWKDSEDRMDAMSRAYFTIANQKPELQHAVLEDFPYSYLWNKELEAKNGYQLPLFILNSAKADDGTKGWVHPFQEDPFLAAGIVDLSKRQYEGHTAYISYPDALFLTNRFPFLSPAAKVEGEGHFVDVGAIENSGLGTIAQILHKMQAKQDKVAAYKAFFQQKLVVLSLRNAKSRYIKDKFDAEAQNQLNRSISKSEISAFFNSVAQAGMTGTPKKLDEVFAENGEVGAGFNIQFEKINLPFLIDTYDPHLVFQNQITRDISGKVDAVNKDIYTLFGCENEECWKAIVPPPLGRLVVEPSRTYTRLMLKHPDVKEVFDTLAVLK